MRLVIQRVRSATVEVAGETVGRIGIGMLVLVGIEKGDDAATVDAAADKLGSLRLFSDQDGKINLDSAAVGGAFLIVSQFTLAASLGRGRRPSFDRAAPASRAQPLCDRLAGELERRGFPVATGRFGASMQVELINDGPVTFVLDLAPG